MYVGKIVEIAETKTLFKAPKHPYTEALLFGCAQAESRACAPSRIVLKGRSGRSRPHPPSGCYFHPRCAHAIDRCKTETPQLEEIQPGQYVSCHRAREITLQGVEAQRDGMTNA